MAVINARPAMRTANGQGARRFALVGSLFLVGWGLLQAVRPVRLPAPDPWLGVAHVAYVVLPLLLALGFLRAAWAATRSAYR